MNKLLKMTNNEQGFVLVASLMMLMILMVIGIAATNTTTLELQISGNDKLSKQVFYQAEGAVAETVREIKNTEDNPNLDVLTLPWLHSEDAVVMAGRLTPATEQTDIHDAPFWTANAAASILPVPGLLQRIVVHRGITDGYSKSDPTAPHDFDVYGRSQQNNAFTGIKVTSQIVIAQ